MRACLSFNKLIFALSWTAIVVIPVQASIEIKECNVRSVVKAKPSVVWDAIRHQRKTDTEHRKLVSYHDNEAVLQENFPGLPIIGAATCLYKESEIPLQRIDYSLIKSDQFKVFEGSWVLTPSADGQNTIVNLSSSLDPGLRVPFWKELTKMATMKHIRKRLSDVQRDAESCH